METLLTPSLHEATDALISNLLASEAFIHYQQAQTFLDDDRQAHKLLEQLSQAQANLRQIQANGGVIQAEVDLVRTLHEQVQGNAIIMTYAQAQQEVINFLREINDEISQLLGINFASFSNRTNC